MVRTCRLCLAIWPDTQQLLGFRLSFRTLVTPLGLRATLCWQGGTVEDDERLDAVVREEINLLKAVVHEAGRIRAAHHLERALLCALVQPVVPVDCGSPAGKVAQVRIRRHLVHKGQQVLYAHESRVERSAGFREGVCLSERAAAQLSCSKVHSDIVPPARCFRANTIARAPPQTNPSMAPFWWPVRLTLLLFLASLGAHGQSDDVFTGAAEPIVNTSISFFNVGACTSVAAVKIDFDGEFCPSVFRSGSRCQVPGPYGREVYVDLIGLVSHIDITLLNPAEDDVNLTTPERVYLSQGQRRNFVGVYIRRGTLAPECGTGFTVLHVNEDPGDIRARYFRSEFRNAAIDVGAVDVVSNGDSTIATLDEGHSVAIDQLLVTADDIPTAVGISFVSAIAGTAALALPADGSGRLWGSTCELAATAFVLYGRPPEIPLAVLRLDASKDACVYSEATTAKFPAEVAFYNTVATGQSLTFAFGLSPFLPYSSLVTSLPLAWTQRDQGLAMQPGELWVKVVDAATGGVIVLSQRVPINLQRRNLVGVSLGSCPTCYILDMLQADNETHTAPPVAPNHFRLLFSHAALTMPAAAIAANDDIQLFDVAPGSRRHLDHPLLPPHQSGRILKISFDTGGHSSNTYSTLIDLSTLCDGAAYAVVLMGTLDRLDVYDPLLVRVGGTSTTCTLSDASNNAGESSSMTMLNVAPQSASVRFEWGRTLLSLTRRSVALPFRGSTVSDVPVGELFVRLLKPDPPNEPLTPILVVNTHSQARNAILAYAYPVASDSVLPGGQHTVGIYTHGRSGSNTSTSASSTAGRPLAWRLADLTSQAEVIPAGQVRALVVSAYEDGAGGGLPPT